MAACDSPGEIRATIWNEIEASFGPSAVVAVWREPGAEYVPDLLGAAVDGLGGGLLGYGGDLSGETGLGSGSGSGGGDLVTMCLGDMLPAIGHRLSPGDQEDIDAGRDMPEAENNGWDEGAQRGASGGPLSSDDDENDKKEDGSSVHDAESSPRDLAQAEAEEDNEARESKRWQSVVTSTERTCSPAWDPSSPRTSGAYPPASSRGRALGNNAPSDGSIIGSRSQVTAAQAAAPEMKATLGSPGAWVVELASAASA